MQKQFIKILSFSLIFSACCAYALPAQALDFSLKVPKFFTELWQQTHAQESDIIAPQPADSGFTPMPMQPMQPQLINEPTPTYREPINNPQNYIDPGANQPSPTCRIDGIEQPGSCDQYNNQINTDGQQPIQNNYEGKQLMNQENQNVREQQNQEKMLKDMKRGVRQMETMIKQFDTLIIKTEKAGGVIEDAIKEKVEKARELLNKIKNATTVEEMGDDTMEQLNETMQELDEIRRETLEAAQRLTNIKRDIKNMERGVASFEKQLAKLQKQKVVVPQDVQDNLGKIKMIVNTIKNAKTWSEVENAGVEDLGDLFDSLNESREALEMLARWPQTLKQIDKELTNFQRQIKKVKTTIDKLTKQGIDVTENYAQFTADVESLKTVREEAVAKMQAGSATEAFDLLESDFFYKMDDVAENIKIIDVMSNLGKFNSNFKRQLTAAKNTINRLARGGGDVSTLREIYAEAESKGKEIATLMKQKPIDTDTILVAVEELEEINVEFNNNSEAMGGGSPMPWDQGQQQFKELQVSQNFNSYLPQQKTNPVGESNPQPSP